MNLKTIATYNSEIRASMIKTRLDFEGIPCHLACDILSFRSGVLKRIDLQVFESDTADALKILAMFDLENVS